MNVIAIHGNTFPVKDQLKSLGGRWNAEKKAWMVPADKADQAYKLVLGAAKTNGSYKTYSRAGWSGCSCGSIEGQPRRSDCWTCKHDAE